MAFNVSMDFIDFYSKWTYCAGHYKIIKKFELTETVRNIVRSVKDFIVSTDENFAAVREVLP